MALVVVLFVISYGIFMGRKLDLSGAYFGPLYLAILNVMVWIALTVATCTFIQKINKRFGEAEFNGPKLKLKFYLAVFSLSFFVRGTWDLAITIKPIVWDDPKKFAPVLFSLYFLTEWTPIFILYLAHTQAFVKLIKRERERAQSLDTSNGKVSEPSFLVPEDYNKHDEFNMLQAAGG